MTEEQKLKIFDIIMSSHSDIEVKYITKILKNKELIKKGYTEEVIKLISNTQETNNKEKIYLSTTNKKLIEKEYFLNYLKILSNTTDSKAELYNRLSLADYIITNNILLDIINIIEQEKFNDSINLRYIDKLINNLIIYNNKGKIIPGTDFVKLIKIFSNAEDHNQSFYYLNIISNKRLLDRKGRVLIAENACTDTNINYHNEYIDNIIKKAIDKGIEISSNETLKSKKLIKSKNRSDIHV